MFMMNKEVISALNKAIENHQSVAFVTITQTNGSAPCYIGQNMLVHHDGSTVGTVGGGALESNIIDKSVEAIKLGEDQSFVINLSDINMSCGGMCSGFIQTMKKTRQLVIVGGGHIGKHIYDMGVSLDFEIIVIDDREEYANKNRFKDSVVICEDIKNAIDHYEFNEEAYFVIVTKGHDTDFEALKAVLMKNSNYPYVGIIGSKSKLTKIYSQLEKDGISKKKIEQVYGPIGLKIAENNPAEIAVSILAEILSVKNNSLTTHKKGI